MFLENPITLPPIEVPAIPLFPIGSVVRVLPDTRPGVRFQQGTSIPKAHVVKHMGDGDYEVSPFGGSKKRRVSGDCLVPMSYTALDEIFDRGGGNSNAVAKLHVGRAVRAAATVVKQLKEKTRQAQKKAKISERESKKIVREARKAVDTGR